jgi:hypothetical protein
MKNIGNVLRLAAPLYVESLAEAHRQSGIAVINGALTVAARFGDELRAASEDATLTPHGRVLRTDRAKASAIAALASIAETAKTKELNGRADAIQKALLAKAVPVVPKDLPPETLGDIRDQLRGLSADERLSVYRTTSDPLVLAAIEQAPATLDDKRRRFEPFVDPAEIETAQRARAEAADPVAATTLRELRDLADVYQRAINLVRHDIETAAP